MKTQLARADALRVRLETALGRERYVDWLGRYRAWLDRNNIPAESDGWPSEDAYADTNIEAFISENVIVEDEA